MTLQHLMPEQPIEHTEASLEQAYITEYLRTHGFRRAELLALPQEQAAEVMRAASLYASLRMSEVEARSHLVTELHGGPRPI